MILMAKKIMIQGTASNVGKSIIVTALCRIFRQDGYRVVPFKAQNMALNSFVTPSGGEIGRAQAVQAQAAGLEPSVEMNPILLKPTGDASSQVIVLGKPIGNMSARDYHLGRNLELFQVIRDVLQKLDEEFEIIVIEGAGSPAEVNLKERDLANMRTARLAGAPVLLVADIDRGGALASVVGTLALLEPEEEQLVRGIIFNKFRGDPALLEPALDFLEERTGKPVLGVLPYLQDLRLPAEDSVCLEEPSPEPPGEIEVAVIYLPRISNFTDFDALALEPGVRVRYVKDGEPLGSPDLIIIPGTKNTIEDLFYLYETGYAAAVRKAAAQGVPVCGLCGGYQMLGRQLRDPEHVESSRGELPGLSLLDTVTTFSREKVLAQAIGEICGEGELFREVRGLCVSGYEIHMGRTFLGEGARPLLRVRARQGVPCEDWDGAVDATGLVWGTYFHGIFDNDQFRAYLLRWLRRRKGLPDHPLGSWSSRDFLDKEIDRLAARCRESLDLAGIYELMGLPERRGE
ncbi:MAG: Cobyric acid synthase [Thermoanaerobacterales bacterium 50_218]|nr:MAG: Cobyric acid synthase [Thermoanaerobacterales bacterium 50_218]